eukprot:gene11024-19868_t
MKWCDEIYEDEIPAPMKDLLQCLASESPVSSYLPSDNELSVHVNELCSTTDTGVAIGSNIAAMAFIQQVAPVIFNALTTIQSLPLPDAWRKLFLLLQKKSSNSYNKEPHTLPVATEAQKNNGLAYFPNWPVQCSRGYYHQDKKKKYEGQCKKEAKKMTLLPGLFTVYCEHGKTGNLLRLRNNGVPGITECTLYDIPDEISNRYM